MGKHRAPEPNGASNSDADTRVLPLAKSYSQGGYSPNPNGNFETWWEDYVTAPIEAANDLDNTKSIPLTKNMPVEDVDGGEVDVWKVFAYLIMFSIGAVVLFYVLAAALAILFLALVVGGAWMARK